MSERRTVTDADGVPLATYTPVEREPRDLDVLGSTRDQLRQSHSR